MAITITSDLTSVTTADSTTAQGTWSRVNGTNAGNPALELDGKIEGAGCLVAKAGATIGTTDAGLSIPLTATFNASGKHIFTWRNNTTPANMNSKATAGTSFHISSEATYGTTNYKRWYLDGGDTDIIGGWKCYVIDPASAGNISAGTPVLTALKTLAFLHRQLTAVTTTLNNVAIDAVKVGTGLTATASSAGDTITLAGIYATDSLNTNAWGIVTQNAGVYYGAAKITIGSATQVNTCLFKATNDVLVWRDYPVANTLYAFNLVGLIAFKTTFQLGNKDGSNNTSDGCVVRGQGAAVWNIVCDANSGFKAYASALANCRASTLSDTSELRDTAVSASGTFDVNGAAIVKCTFSAHTATQMKVDSTAEMSNITDSAFSSTGTGHAFELTVVGTYSFSGIKFSGYAASNGSTGNETVYNNSGGAITINVSGGTTPTIRNGAGASTTVNNSVALTLTGLVVGSDIVILDAGTSTIRVQVDAHGTSSYVYSFSTGGNVDIGVIKQGYIVLYVRNYPLPAANASLPISQVLDRNFT